MRRVLTGVPHVERGHFLTPIAALTAALQSQGLRTGYEELMFLGGGAFRAYWSSEWREDSAFACSEDVVANAAATQGFDTTASACEDEGEAWLKIRESIDSGMPVLTSGIVSTSDWAVIVGYEENPRGLLLNTYSDNLRGPAMREFAEWAGWTYAGGGRFPLMTLRRVGRVMDNVAAVRAAMERAVGLSSEGTAQIADVGGSRRLYHSGLEAYRRWAVDVRAIANGVAGDELGGRVRVCNLNVRALIDARRAAIKYLENAKRHGNRQVFDMTVAADRFAREVHALESATSEMPWPGGKPHKEALREATAMAGERARRERCAAAIQRAGDEERNAVAALSRVLKQLS